QGDAVALISDHGFEKIDAEVNLAALASKQGITGVRAIGAVAIAETDAAAAFLRDTAKDPRYGIGRAIRKEELARFAPQYANVAAVFESAPGVLFGGDTKGEIISKLHQIG